jgi:hypothetical protein
MKGRGNLFCRQCKNSNLEQIYNFGDMPIANELPTTKDSQIELYPLEFKICFKCGLGQVGEPITPKRLFEDYRYESSISETWINNGLQFSKKMMKECDLGINDLVVEIASNDGYLLQHFRNAGVSSIGIEPAGNIAKKANMKGIRTINKFFSEELAIELRSQHGKPRLIIANNVLAHVPDLNDFFSGISQLSSEKTVVTIENPSIVNIMHKNQYDTIYHEHFSYLSVNSVLRLADQNNLSLISVEKLGTHGGTNRYFLREKGSVRPNANIQNYAMEEKELGLFDREVWKGTSTKITDSIDNIRNWFNSKSQNQDKVIGFTAAAKSSTLINSVKLDEKKLKMVVDTSKEKQGRYIPLTMIPIVDIETAKKYNPTDIVIFSWNIAEEIYALIQSEFNNSVRCWVLIPKIKQMGKNNG